MEAAKESFAQRHSVNFQLSIINCQLHQVCTALNLLEHGLSQS